MNLSSIRKFLEWYFCCYRCEICQFKKSAIIFFLQVLIRLEQNHCGIFLTANNNLPPPPPPIRPLMTSVYCHLQEEGKMFFEKANENVSEGIFFFFGSCDRM